VLSPGVRPQDNFLFLNTDDPDHNRFNLMISMVASAEVILLAFAAFFSRPWRHRLPSAWWTLLGWALLAALLTCSFTSSLWEHLPELRYLQLPWRWLLCLNAALTLLITMASRRRMVRVLVCIALFAVLAFDWHRVQPPWWEKAADISEMLGNQQNGAGYEGTDEYVPVGADPYELTRDAPRVALDQMADQSPQIRIQEWNAESKLFTADVSDSGQLVLRLLNYPAWRVEVNGKVVATDTREVTGQMLIPVQAGENRVRITFIRTRDRTVGAVISLVTALFLGSFVVRRRLKTDHKHSSA